MKPRRLLLQDAGLATWTPDDPDFYRQRAALIATHGYVAVTHMSTAAKA